MVNNTKKAIYTFLLVKSPLVRYY